jgi:hypothetical protein
MSPIGLRNISILKLFSSIPIGRPYAMEALYLSPLKRKKTKKPLHYKTLFPVNLINSL